MSPSLAWAPIARAATAATGAAAGASASRERHPGAAPDRKVARAVEEMRLTLQRSHHRVTTKLACITRRQHLASRPLDAMLDPTRDLDHTTPLYRTQPHHPTITKKYSNTTSPRQLDASLASALATNPTRDIDHPTPLPDSTETTPLYQNRRLNSASASRQLDALLYLLRALPLWLHGASLAERTGEVRTQSACICMRICISLYLYLASAQAPSQNEQRSCAPQSLRLPLSR